MKWLKLALLILAGFLLANQLDNPVLSHLTDRNWLVGYIQKKRGFRACGHLHIQCGVFVVEWAKASHRIGIRLFIPRPIRRAYHLICLCFWGDI